MIGYFSMPGSAERLVILALLLIPLGGAVVRFFCARIVRIRQPTFLRALGCSILAPLASVPLWLLMGSIPLLGPVLTLIGVLLIDSLITRAIFRTTFGKALAAVTLTWILEGILAAILLKLLALAGLVPGPDYEVEAQGPALVFPAGLQPPASGLFHDFPLACPTSVVHNTS